MKTAPTSSIKFMMTAKGISLRYLAEKTGLSYGYVSNLISGSKKSKNGLAAIIEALGMKNIISDTEAETPCAETNVEPRRDSE